VPFDAPFLRTPGECRTTTIHRRPPRPADAHR
jgi:hypothetical protein